MCNILPYRSKPRTLNSRDSLKMRTYVQYKHICVHALSDDFITANELHSFLTSHHNHQYHACEVASRTVGGVLCGVSVTNPAQTRAMLDRCIIFPLRHRDETNDRQMILIRSHNWQHSRSVYYYESDTIGSASSPHKDSFRLSDLSKEVMISNGSRLYSRMIWRPTSYTKADAELLKEVKKPQWPDPRPQNECIFDIFS